MKRLTWGENHVVTIWLHNGCNIAFHFNISYATMHIFLAFFYIIFLPFFSHDLKPFSLHLAALKANIFFLFSFGLKRTNTNKNFHIQSSGKWEKERRKKIPLRRCIINCLGLNILILATTNLLVIFNRVNSMKFFSTIL